MSALLCLGSALPKSNQFIRPMSPFDVVSATRRLASSDKRFAAALEYAEAISSGKAGKQADTLMAALGNATAMSAENTCNIVNLYTSDGCTCKVPPSMTKAGGTRLLVHQRQAKHKLAPKRVPSPPQRMKRLTM